MADNITATLPIKFDRPLILASKSPRRSQLLSRAGFTFTVKTKEVEEDYPNSLITEKVPAYLAEKKAEACREFILNQEIIIAADTVVIKDGVIYGKPKDRAEAIHILKTLSDSTHQVITGVCLLSQYEKQVFSSQSNVIFDPLSESEIAYYVDTCQPYDKAGAYAIQEWIGLCKIKKIEGTRSNIMGLPVNLLYQHLTQRKWS